MCNVGIDSVLPRLFGYHTIHEFGNSIDKPCIAGFIVVLFGLAD